MHTITAAGILAIAAALLPHSTPARRLDAPANELGLPVKDAAGARITYTREELAAQRPGPVAGALSLLPPGGVIARWGYAGFGNGIGLSKIVLADREIYVGGSTSTFGPNDYWYVLRRVGSGYEQVFVSRQLPGIIGLAVADVSGDAAKEIVVARADGTVVLYDQRTRAELTTLSVPSSDVAGLAVRDLDGDGKAEILLTTTNFSSNTLYVLSGTGALVWQLAGAGGVDVVVGNMDDDPSLEIATTSGTVVDWATRSVQWQRPQGFGIDLEVGDVDNDGREELIAAQDWDFVWCFDVDTKLPKWSLPIFDIGAIWVGNADADPALELIVGDGQWGDVHAFNTTTLVEKWAIPNPEHGVTFVTVGDPDANGTLDVLWGAGATSTGPDRLYVANLTTHTIDWQNVQLEGPFLPPQRGDIDGDGVPELVTASTSSDAGYDSGRIVVLDEATLRVRAISPPIVGNLAWTGLHDLRLRNVDADPQLEIVVAADRLYDGVIEIYDFAGPTNTFALKWTNPVRPVGSPFYSVDVADVDGDGQLEVVGGVGRAHTGSVGTFMYVYSYPSGAEEWHTFALTTGWEPISGLAVLTAGGGTADVVAMVDGESLSFFNGMGQPQAILDDTFRFLGPDAGSSGRSFLVGLDDGSVRQYQRDTNGYSVAWTRSLGGARVDGLSMLPGGEMAAAIAGGLAFYPQRDSPVAWESEDYGVRGGVNLGTGAQRRPFVGGSYGLFSLAPWRALLDVQPRTGPSSGGTLLTALGTAFDDAARLYVGAKEASAAQVIDPTHITGTTPPQRPCSVHAVTVVNPDMSFEVMDDAFTAGRGFSLPGCAGRPSATLAEKE